jgi:hypothetical protein
VEQMLLARQDAPDTIRLEFGIRCCHSE